MSSKLITHNFSLDLDKYRSHEHMIYRTLKDKRNNLTTTNVIPGTQCYINYLSLLVSLRDKWVSTGYLDLGMIPIIMGPSFMHEPLTKTLLPIIESKGLLIHPMPSVSFLIQDSMRGFTDYWAFRDDVADFLGTTPDKVTTKETLEKLMGVKFE